MSSLEWAEEEDGKKIKRLKDEKKITNNSSKEIAHVLDPYRAATQKAEMKA